MRIEFKGLKIKNFKSFGESAIHLDREGFVLVQGENRNPEDNSKSNGVGKSSIFDAIVWALTGKTIQGSTNVENIYVNGTTLVELGFEYNGDTYVVGRSKNPSKLYVYKNGGNISGKGIRDTEKILEENVTGDVTYQLISSVIILGQGLPNKFSNNTPSGRKAVLESLANTDFMINDLKTRVGNRAYEIDTAIRSSEDARLEEVTRKRVLEDQLNNIYIELEDINKVDRASLSVELSRLQHKVESITEDIANMKLNRVSTQQAKEDCQINIDEINEDRYEKVTGFIPPVDVDILKTEHAHCSAQLKSADNELRTLLNIKDTCPTCGQKLEGVEIPTDKIESLKQSIEKMSDDRESLRIQIKQGEEENLKAKESLNEYRLKELEDSKKAMELIEKDIKILTTDIDGANAMLRSAESDITGISNFLNECDSNKARLESLRDETIENISRCDKGIEEAEVSITVLENRKSVVNKFNTVLKRDFRSYLLTNVVDYINRKVAEYSNEVFGNKNLSISIDGNDIALRFDGKDYEMLSGGEKQKVDVITQLAIRDLLCDYSNFSCNLLVVDEVFDGLDSVGCDNVLNLLSSHLSDTDCMYIITHHGDLNIPADDYINIVKGADKISKIVG